MHPIDFIAGLFPLGLSLFLLFGDKNMLWRTLHDDLGPHTSRPTSAVILGIFFMMMTFWLWGRNIIFR
jgi:hypothetical protein